MTSPPLPSRDLSPWLPLAPRTFAILLVLARGRCHGYRLMRELREGSAGERWEVGPATLYRTLRTLEQEGLLTAREGPDGESGGPPRKEYALSELGHRVASAEAARMARLVGVATRRKLVEQE